MRIYKPLTEAQKLRKAQLHAIWCSKNRDKRRASAARFRKIHRDRIYAQNKEWVSKNQDRIRDYRKAYREKHREKLNLKCKEYYKLRYNSDAAYKSKIISQTKSWGQANKSKRREIYNRWRINNLRHCAIKGAKRRTLVRNGEVAEKGIAQFVLLLKSIAVIPCYYCKRLVATGDVHIDHVFPISKGGQHSMANICASCPECNFSKNDSTFDVWPKTGQMFLQL